MKQKLGDLTGSAIDDEASDINEMDETPEDDEESGNTPSGDSGESTPGGMSGNRLLDDARPPISAELRRR